LHGAPHGGYRHAQVKQDRKIVHHSAEGRAISHDLSVVEQISDRVAVMYVGKLVEFAPTETLFHSPKHPYTQALLMSVPRPSPTARPRAVLRGEVPSSANPPSGCYFHPRCPFAVAQCAGIEPALLEVDPGHFVRCHLAQELRLGGVTAMELPEMDLQGN